VTIYTVILLVILILVLLTISRQHIMFPLIMVTCCVPLDQRIIILNLDFPLIRILMLICLFRMAIKGENRVIQWNNFDKLILCLQGIGFLVYIIRNSNLSAIIFQFGLMFDNLGLYWIFRQYIRDWKDICNMFRILAFFAIITAPFIALEKFQDSSLFSIFGHTAGEFHRGRYRAAGAFSHSILMGCFWATLLPFFYSQIKINKYFIFYWLAILSSLSSIYFSGSTTPVMTVIAVIIFWNIYRYRMYGKKIFWGTCAGLFLLHLVMKAPVWHLLSRIDIFSGSTGYHRYLLIDNFLGHISEWFFLGMNSTSHWGHVQGDITNQIILEGVRGGMITLIILIIILFNAVKIPGRLSLNSNSAEIKWISWGICVAMLGHFITFWGVSYFGQINILLYFTFALIGFSLDVESRDVAR